MNELIEKIKKIMTDVATGQAKIQDTNDEYKKLFRELDDIFSSTNQNRIKELKTIKSDYFDISKLIRFCEELNSAFSLENFLSTAMLVRAIADHIPPIFGKTSFTEVANNHGSKSFKDSIKNLDNS